MADTPAYGDPTTAPFWDAAGDHLLLQHCEQCGSWQFYPRPFCLSCSGPVAWRAAAGFGTVYSLTTVRMPVSDAHPPPYAVALVDLDEGPRLLAQVEGDVVIGSRVEVCWRARPEVPPLYAFRPVGDRAGG